MKRGLLFTIIYTAALSFASSSQGQGRIHLDNYTTYGPDIVYSPSGTGIKNGVGATTWTIGFYYGLSDLTGSVGSDSSGIGSTSFNGLTLATGLGSTASLVGPQAPGEFHALSEYIIPGYTSGVVTLEVVAYSGSDYASSFLRGHSTAFTMTPSTGPGLVPVGAAMPSFVIPVPEPSAIALASMGVAAWIVSRNKRKGQSVATQV